jgi:hypothetical protein
MKPFDLIFRHHESGSFLAIEGDGRVAYAYFHSSSGEILGDVWHCNRCRTPSDPEWSDKTRQPFANPSAFARDNVGFPLPRKGSEVTVRWSQGPVRPIDGRDLRRGHPDRGAVRRRYTGLVDRGEGWTPREDSTGGNLPPAPRRARSMTSFFRLSAPDNDSHMCGSSSKLLTGLSGLEICAACGYKTDPFFINPRFRVKRRIYDASFTYDGYLIISLKFNEACHRAKLTGFEVQCTH